MNKLKKLFVTTGILQCILLLVGYIFLLYDKNDYLLVGMFVYSLFLVFFIIEHRQSHRLLINHTAVIFVIFLFLYGIYNSVISLFFHGEVPMDTYVSTIIYASTLPAFVLAWMTRKNTDYTLLYRNQLAKKKTNGFYNYFLVIFLSILLMYKTYFFVSNDMFFNLHGALNSNRLEFVENVSQLYVVTGLLVSGIYLYFIFYYKKIPRKLLFFLGVTLVYYILLQLAAGNRRDFMPMILGIVWVFVNSKKIKFNILGFVLLLLMVQVFNYFGALRSSTMDRSIDVYQDLMKSNEFVYPFQTLKYEMAEYQKNENTYEFLYGYSYIVAPLTFIPREIFPDKPKSLANEFVVKHFSSKYRIIGFAYTPVTESFVNFGLLGPFFVFLIVGRIVSFVQGSKNQVVNFIFFTMILDFCRGEFSTVVYQFVFISLFLFLLPSIKNILLIKKVYNY